MAKVNLSGGRNFRLSSGPGGFSRQLYRATRSGALQNLGDNRGAIIQGLKGRSGAIRGGRFGAGERQATLNKIKALARGKLTADDKRDLKVLLKALGSAPPETESPPPPSPPPPASAGQAILARRRLKGSVNEFQGDPRARLGIGAEAAKARFLNKSGESKPGTAAAPTPPPGATPPAGAKAPAPRRLGEGGPESLGERKEAPAPGKEAPAPAAPGKETSAPAAEAPASALGPSADEEE